ncbi:DUF1624 domain-containing protein [Plantibacter sp. VKM Ac-2885]|uniref:heparan-alpha-glucosaminide N-acetyltransferase domain-containing protein n=1 Tax=Plantibacter sp. VKM Ac-2885 TaxID=2783828 RepID=UPI00188BF6FE|nr:heparan-alpha-glucosaminide N-acetyltransferase domain-containing protein [Plantibacter sp. VKM Ac-2885]MBF4514081.1 DUF1624 domain-containing protein [Plantibacter sp. VKM Ac-2885]
MPAPILTLVTGFPSTLFAVLGGVSVALSIRRFQDSGQHLRATLTVAVRGLLIAVIGALLAIAPSMVILVLVYYGATMIVLAVIVNLKSWMLLTLTTLLVVLGPQLNVVVFNAPDQDTIGELSFTSPLAFLRTVAFTGMDPVITWLGYMIVGLLIGRWALARRSDGRGTTGPRLLGVGSVLLLLGVASDLASRPAVVDFPQWRRSIPENCRRDGGRRAGLCSSSRGGWIALMNAAPHTGSTADMIRTMGAAIPVLGLLLWGTAKSRPMNVPMRVLQKAGSAPLTIYVAHVLSTSLMMAAVDAGASSYSAWWASGPGALALQYLGICALGILLAGLSRRGPLESAVSGVTRRIVGLLPGS